MRKKQEGIECTRAIKEIGQKPVSISLENGLSWLFDDEEVQFIWSMVNPLIREEESVRQDLLHVIAYMWVTTRGHSKAQQVKEEHEKSKAESVKEKK